MGINSNQFKGTQGEWINDIPSSVRLEGKLSNACDVANNEGVYVATVYGSTPKICKANAKLIISAPLLLKELQKVRLDIKLSGAFREDSPIVKGIDEVINKAL
ncbi:MAG: hypothetical protein KUG81_06535 [Gammaproteobacteria bacterium]|nr:hypothetical protein [Gammaproteobacteria bacterium]